MGPQGLSGQETGPSPGAVPTVPIIVRPFRLASSLVRDRAGANGQKARKPDRNGPPERPERPPN
jgi:hypothetical protein